MAHLFAGASPPEEYIILVFCRDIWHCPPSVFRQQSPVDLRNAMISLAAEAAVRKR